MKKCKGEGEKGRICHTPCHCSEWKRRDDYAWSGDVTFVIAFFKNDYEVLSLLYLWITLLILLLQFVVIETLIIEDGHCKSSGMKFIV